MQIGLKYVVLKREDIEEALTDTEMMVLRQICQRIFWYRLGQGKRENQYLVINQDEPYYQDVVRLISDYHDEIKAMMGSIRR